ncbi:hypothetical protein GbCGDNIH2_10001 [Granulibacter bethesdensis]|uniref:Uncharacterized protein n=1 Tax=Granulibacter bethesdensis (strain ATCC BAA-1260 / CGDNIH1) TaxID=391165 RepID=A0A286M317_GRABC|nr:hypothetical protein GbCGDNIH5_10001 [Granulibacter bethesdensis]ASV62416.1 hypothetical protein GbCGDNIH1_10001 [Granulibacter bethesdensis CGDNIH1]ASV62547.1 hypothetical protein GbCGDNIH1I4_10001 [Granulibacter bethesdensis]ASV62571.1 hypothetical protein GbCGDNIH7_10001 [Granulibacter bethesdensis]ASW28589.1 hypothetical protein GbCGDNIH2_10001 [Granulibacter bethesdensis]
MLHWAIRHLFSQPADRELLMIIPWVDNGLIYSCAVYIMFVT